MKRYLSYDVGALITMIISVGVAIVAYGGGYLPYDIYNLPAWILGPLGLYSLVYALVSNEGFYYSVWGMILIAFAAISALYRLVNVAVVVGLLLVVVGVTAAIAYMREPKKTVPK
jgi:hypothetical protein